MMTDEGVKTIEDFIREIREKIKEEREKERKLREELMNYIHYLHERTRQERERHKYHILPVYPKPHTVRFPPGPKPMTKPQILEEFRKHVEYIRQHLLNVEETEKPIYVKPQIERQSLIEEVSHILHKGKPSVGVSTKEHVAEKAGVIHRLWWLPIIALLFML